MFLFTSLCGYSELLETLHKMSGAPKLSLEPSNVPAGNPGPAQRFSSIFLYVRGNESPSGENESRSGENESRSGEEESLGVPGCFLSSRLCH